jgi:PAS domain S-box-containing protein
MTSSRKAADKKTKTVARRTPRRPPAGMSEHFNEMFENASDIIILNDRDGVILAANRAAREFGGYGIEDVGKVRLGDLLLPHEHEAAMVLTRRVLDDLPVPQVYEREVITRSGRRRVLELRSNVVHRRGRPSLLQTIGRDVTEKKEAAELQAALLQVSQALLTAQSLDQLGQAICEEASRVLHVDGAYLWLPRGGDLIGCAASGRGAKEFIGVRRSAVDSLIGRIFRVGEIVVVNDLANSSYRLEGAIAFGVQSMLSVPLRRGGPAVGVLVFTDSTDPERFGTTAVERARILAAQTTVAIESALAREREEEEGKVSAALLHVTRAIRESLEEAEVLPRIARSAREALEVDWAVVALWEAARGVFRVYAAEGLSREADEELRLMDLGPDSLQMVKPLMEGKTEIIEEPRGRLALWERWGISSLIAVPMIRGDRVIGNFVAGFRERRGPFSARARRVAEGIAAQAAVAVENARLVEALRRANQLKSEFLGTMSHELRTPLSAILGYADLMLDGAMGAVGKEQADVLERMLLNGRGLLELINMTLDASRLEAGRIRLDVSDFRIEDLLNELRGEFHLGANDGEVALRWPEAMEVAPVRTDRGKLKVVLRNVIENALKFTSRGEVAVEVGRESASGIPAPASRRISRRPSSRCFASSKTANCAVAEEWDWVCTWFVATQSCSAARLGSRARSGRVRFSPSTSHATLPVLPEPPIGRAAIRRCARRTDRRGRSPLR